MAISTYAIASVHVHVRPPCPPVPALSDRPVRLSGGTERTARCLACLVERGDELLQPLRLGQPFTELQPESTRQMLKRMCGQVNESLSSLGTPPGPDSLPLTSPPAHGLDGG